MAALLIILLYNIHLYRLATVAGDMTSKDVSMTTMTSHRAGMWRIPVNPMMLTSIVDGRCYCTPVTFKHTQTDRESGGSRRSGAVLPASSWASPISWKFINIAAVKLKVKLTVKQEAQLSRRDRATPAVTVSCTLVNYWTTLWTRIFFGFYKTRHILLSDSANCSVLRAVVLTQYRRVTDRRTDRQTDERTDGIAVASTVLAMRALRRAVKMRF